MPEHESPRLIRRFSEILGLIDRGRFETSLNDAMREAIEAIRAQPGEKGKASIKIEMEIAAQGEMMQIKPKLVVKLPEGASYTPLVLWDYEGSFTAQHPSQIDMFAPRQAREQVTGETPELAAR